MSLDKAKKFQKMVRGDHVNVQESFENETIKQIRSIELESLKQQIFVNAFSLITDDVLKGKCLDISTHYRLFKDDESHFKIDDLSDDEKDKFKKCINECIQQECNVIIKEKESIPTDLVKLIESESVMFNTLKNKVNTYLSLLKKYMSNKNEINSSMTKLLDSSYVNITESKRLSNQVDFLNKSVNKLQSEIICKFSSKELYESLEKYHNSLEKEYETNLVKLEDLQKLQEKYMQVDGPQYRALVKNFTRTKEMIKLKTEMFNSY